jgi:hypothetical protein
VIVALTSVSVHVTFNGSTMNGDTPVKNEFVNLPVALAVPGMMAAARRSDGPCEANRWLGVSELACPAGTAQARRTIAIKTATARPVVVPSSARRIVGVTTFNT